MHPEVTKAQPSEKEVRDRVMYVDGLGQGFKLLSHNGRIAYALAEVLVCRVVRESTELVLDSLGQRRVCDDRILRLLVRKVRIEVGHIKYGFLMK
jgi:hypothetical protein